MEKVMPQDVEELLQELEVEYGSQESLPQKVEEHLRILDSGGLSFSRRNAAEQLGRVETSSPRIVRALIAAYESDPHSEVNRAAEESLGTPVHQKYLQRHPDLMEVAEAALQQRPGSDRQLPHPDKSVGIDGERFGIRAGAYLIDALVLVLLIYATSFVAGFVLGLVLALAGREFYFAEEPTSYLGSIGGVVLFVLYFALFEWLYGASLGKVILRLRVVMKNGEPCTFWAALIRAGLRYVDAVFFAIPAYVSMKPPFYQRIGDRAAKTVVVNSRASVIRQPRAGGWFLVAAVLFLVVGSGIAFLLLASSVRMEGAGLQTEEYAVTDRSLVPLPAPPIPEGMLQPEPSRISGLAWANLSTSDPHETYLEGGKVTQEQRSQALALQPQPCPTARCTSEGASACGGG